MLRRLVEMSLILYVFALLLPDFSGAALPGDTLRTDTGEIIIVPDYGLPGVDYADSQFIASFIPGYLTLPEGQSEAYLDSCIVEDSLRSIMNSL